MTPQLEQAKHLLAAGQRDQTAVRILRKDAESPVEITLFHAQQAAEKYIKAVLVLRGVATPTNWSRFTPAKAQKPGC